MAPGGESREQSMNRTDSRMGYVFGEFWGPLMVGDDADAGLICEALLGPFGKPKPDAVIPAQRVAAGEDEASSLRYSQECSG